MAGDAPEKKVIFSKYELGRLLGRGASAKVYLARDVSTGQSVAVKCIAKRKPDLSSTGVVHEIAVMSRLRHPHVVRPIEALATRRHVYLVMELAKGGELFSRLAARGRIHEDLARRYFRQLVSAVGYCHSRGVFHRDIKPENLLLDEHGDLKVSDFGLSGVAPAGSGSLLNTLCGTPAYVAPEILAKKSYEGAGVDVWSCGVVLFVLVAGYLPFNDPNLMAMYRKIYRGEYRSPKWFSPELLRLVSRLLDANPATRITVDGILHDPWFRSGLAEAEWEAIARFHRGVGEEEKLLKAIGEGEERELNAFDIISFSPALDLSGMFERSRGRRERLVCAGPPESVAKRLEAAGKGEGLSVTRKGTRVVMREARGGRVVAAASVHRLAGEMAVVDVVEGGGGAEKRIWETLQAAIER